MRRTVAVVECGVVKAGADPCGWPISRRRDLAAQGLCLQPVKALDIRIINLERSPDRRDSARRQLAGLGLAATLSTAVDGATSDLDRYTPFLSPVNHFVRRPLTRGEVGCFASHYRLWQECVAAGSPMLVLEDDFLIVPEARGVIDRLPEILRRFRYVRLSGILPRASRTVATLPDSRSVVLFSKGPLGTVAYALTPEAASRLLARAVTWREPVDNYIDSFWIHGILPFGVVPYPVQFPPGGSLIERSRFDRGNRLVRFSRQLVRSAQTIRRLAFKASPAWRAAA